jgi:hypothetical protein
MRVEEESWILLLWLIILMTLFSYLLISFTVLSGLEVIKFINSFKHSCIFKFWEQIDCNGFLSSCETAALVIARSWFSAYTSS